MTMKTMKNSLLIAIMLLAAFGLPAQTGDEQAIQKAREEIEATYGAVPSFLEAVPSHTLPGMWEYMKATTNTEASIPPKYRELMRLAVASQIPCDYCVFYHTESAKAYGATEQEIQEAILNGASTRNWSMVLQGNQVDLQEFKEEFQEMMDYMAQQGNDK